MLHTLFIAIHAVSATAAFIAGAAALWRIGGGKSSSNVPWLVAAVILGLTLMEVFMIAAIAASWSAFPTVLRLIFSGFAALGLYMLYRAVLAERLARGYALAERPTIVEHIGFVLISLAVGFAIIFMLRLGLPAWGAALLGVGVVMLGRWIISSISRAVRHQLDTV